VKDWVGDKAKSDRRSSIIGVVVGVPLTLGMYYPWHWLLSHHFESTLASRFTGIPIALPTFCLLAWVYLSISTLIVPPTREVTNLGQQAIAEVNSILDGAAPAVRIGKLLLTDRWVVSRLMGSLGVRIQDIVWIYSIEPQKRQSDYGPPIDFTICTLTKTTTFKMDEIDLQHMLRELLPLCPSAKFGYDEDLVKKFAGRASTKKRVIELSHLPTVQRTLAEKQKAHQQSRAFDTLRPTPISIPTGRREPLPSPARIATAQINHVAPKPRSERDSDSNHRVAGANVRALTDLPKLYGKTVVATFESTFPMICPRCGRPATKQMVQAVSASNRIANLKPWVCESCPDKLVWFSHLWGAGEVFGILSTVIFAFQAQGDRFPGSLINPFFLLSFVSFVSCAVLRRNSRILKACKMTTTTVTLVRTHKDFRAALSNR
jgi:hypothetical protein